MAEVVSLDADLEAGGPRSLVLGGSFRIPGPLFEGEMACGRGGTSGWLGATGPCTRSVDSECDAAAFRGEWHDSRELVCSHKNAVDILGVLLVSLLGFRSLTADLRRTDIDQRRGLKIASDVTSLGRKCDKSELQPSFVSATVERMSCARKFTVKYHACGSPALEEDRDPR